MGAHCVFAATISAALAAAACGTSSDGRPDGSVAFDWETVLDQEGEGGSFRMIWGFGPEDVFAVAGGYVWRWDGTEWYIDHILFEHEPQSTVEKRPVKDRSKAASRAET